ncbi:hypothetical protein KM043_018166 [Ampulex compressa]|nr:hypothetical protein KM043_018166 [Ampulex compressa]
MDLMAFVPNFTTSPNIQQIPTIEHNCEVPPEADEIEQFLKGTSSMSKVRRWFLRNRVLSRKHPLTRWCLKSLTAAKYEINRHLKSHPYMIHPFSSFRS